ncbi:uncharacterized protein ACN427_007709 isoform 1-T1 [Glossina fuscipes fuscipes]
MREILKIKIENYYSMGKARRKYWELNPSAAQGIGKSNTYAAVDLLIEPNEPLTATPSNEEPVLPSAKNCTAKPVPSPAKDNIEKTKATPNIEKIKTTTRILKSNKLNYPESPALNFTQQITSCNESNLLSLNQPSISNYSRAPTRCTSNVRNRLSADYSAGKNKVFLQNSYSDLPDGDADMAS